MKILKLLEEGKINAQEAARLLEAIGESEAGRRRGFIWRGLESIPDMMATMFDTSFKNFTTQERIETTGKKKIEIKGIGGDIEINGTDESNILINKDGLAKIIEEGDILIVKAVSGSVRIDSPKAIDIEVRGVSGNLELNNINGRIEISSVSGDIRGKGLSGSLNGEFVSGDVELEYDKVEGIAIKSRSGDVILRIDESIEAEIEISSIHGDIGCELPLKDVTKRHNYLKGILNAPKSKIEIKNNHGDVVLEKKS